MAAPSFPTGRLGSLAQRASKGLEEATLFSIQVRRKHHIRLGVQVTALVQLPENRHALPPQSK
jgi:hypothetical protein